MEDRRRPSKFIVYWCADRAVDRSDEWVYLEMIVFGLPNGVELSCQALLTERARQFRAKGTLRTGE